MCNAAINHFTCMRSGGRVATLLLAILLLSDSFCFAQPDLENEVPENYSVVKGALSLSNRHYRLGTQSLRWDWVAGDTLIIDLNSTEEALVNANLLIWGKNHFEMWVHHEAPSTDTFQVEFMNWQKRNQFHFSFNTNYKGWRRLLRSYRHDMLKDVVHYDKYWWNVDKIFMVAPATGNGTVYLDNIQYMRASEMKYSDRQMPDLYALASETYYSSDLYYRLDSLSASIPVPNPTAQQIAELETIRQRILTRGIGERPGTSELNAANAKYATYNIETEGDIIRGKDIADPSEIAEMFSTLVRSFIHDNDTDSRDKAINLLRQMLDGGLAGGSGRWFAGTSWGYDDMVFYKALIQAASFADDKLKYQIWDWLQWSTGINLGADPENNGKFDEDNFYVLQDAYLCLILFSPDDAHGVRDLKRLIGYIEQFLQVQFGDTDGMKPDGTAFHHYGHYNAYSYTFAAIIDPILYTFRGTSFLINATAYENLRKVVYAQYLMCNKTQYANSLSGRHPFFTPITFSGGFYTKMSHIGGEILDKPLDEIIAGMRTRLWGPDIPPSGVSAEPDPAGFWQMNYSPVGIYRRNGWAATIKGINNYFWGTEMTSTENRYGRYQSYGTVEIMYPGGFAASGAGETGWDWNKAPGSTAIELPFSQLKLPDGMSFLAEKNKYNFAGGVRFGTPSPTAPSDFILANLHGEYGMFGLNFRQIAATATHNSSFVFRKSIFCFGDKIVCLGSNISNNDGSHNTITTLFQTRLASAGTPTIVDGATKTGTSQSDNLSSSAAHWLIDAFKTGYYVLKGNSIHVERKSQTSPDESGSGATTSADFANAYINHGTAPTDGEYAYVIAPNTTSSAMSAFAGEMASPSTRAFDILQQDGSAHIIRENATGVTGFSLFAANDNLVSNDILKSNDVPCVAIMQIKDDTLRISLVNPDLKLVNNQSTSVPITLKLHGTWAKIPDIPSQYANVLSSEGTETIIQFNPSDGQPAEIGLLKMNAIILPVNLVSFSGRADAVTSQNILSLEVDNDGNTTTFYLERQTSGNGSWSTIAKHDFGAISGRLEYKFIDKDLNNPVLAYRVKWLQPSGQWQYSNIVILKSAATGSLTVSPNPAQHSFWIRLPEKPKGQVKWTLTSSSGVTVKQGLLVNAAEHISVAGIASGIYFLRLSSGQTLQIAIVK